MKKIYSLLVFLIALSWQSFSQSTTTAVVDYNGFLACGGCVVCGNDYWCINTNPSYCGPTPACESRTFVDPVPAGNIVTSIKIDYWTADCNGNYITGTINGVAAPTVNENATGCLCSSAPCGVSVSTSANFPCGFPSYVYGGVNTLQLCTGTAVCVDRVILTITYYLPSQINPSITALGPTSFCQGGSVVLDAGTGYAGYAWNTGANTQTITVSISGTYNVTVTSLSGCTTGNASINVTVNPAPVPTINANGPLNFCQGGSVILDAGAGYSGYSWTTGANSQTISVSTSGSYGVTVTDANGCTGTATINVTANAVPSVSATSTQTGCTVANGTATANPSGGTPNYTYLWSNGDPNQTANNLGAGTYNVTVTDANGCTAQTSVTITTASGPTVSASGTQSGCTVANGTATANPSGGTPNYTYLWSNGDPNQTASNLAAGTYTITLTDANGCSAQTTVTILSSSAPAVTATATPGGCTVANGTATANPTGGTPAYSYSWLPSSQTTQTATGLASGSYVVTITDANGCTATTSITVTTSASPSTTAAAVGNVSCNGGNNGSATTSPSGGTAPYTYSWSTTPSQVSQTATGLSAGNYNITVTDANGCTAVASVTISQPAVLSSTANSTTITCNGGNNGTATSTPSGGTSPYTYAWVTVPVQNTQTATALSAGTYTVNVTDANGCTAQTSVTISQPAPVTLSVSGNDSVCAGDTAVLTATANGGTPNYTYVWVPGPQNGASISVNPTTSTSYTVSMTDANGCTSLTQTFNVLVLPAPNASFDTASNGMFGSVFSFSDLSSGGTTWFWMFGDNSTSNQQNPVHTFPGAGTYTVTQVVFNQFGCPDTFKIVIDFNEGIIIPNVFTPDGNSQNDVWYIPNSGMKEFHVEIFDRWGAKVFETTADEIRWDGRSNAGQLLTDGTYYYNLRAILGTASGEKNYSTKGYITLLTKNQK